MRIACAMAVAAVVSTAGSVFADVAVTNENNGDGGTISFIVGDILRTTSFTVGPAGATINSVTMRVANRDGIGSTFGYTCEIFSDAGGMPGSPIATFGVNNHLQTTPLFETITFTTAGLNVSANTTYWVVMGAAPGSSSGGGDWLGSQIPNETSTLGWTIGNTNSFYFPGPGWVPNGNNPGRFTINITPTPGAAALLGIGGLMASRRRR